MELPNGGVSGQIRRARRCVRLALTSDSRDNHLPEGPVRGVAIHPSRALLVTGGDDYKIKVWGELAASCLRDLP